MRQGIEWPYATNWKRRFLKEISINCEQPSGGTGSNPELNRSHLASLIIELGSDAPRKSCLTPIKNI